METRQSKAWGSIFVISSYINILLYRCKITLRDISEDAFYLHERLSYGIKLGRKVLDRDVNFVSLVPNYYSLVLWLLNFFMFVEYNFSILRLPIEVTVNISCRLVNKHFFNLPGTFIK